MHHSFAEIMADPMTLEPLKLEVVEARGDDVVEGWLVSRGARYPITGGIPRFAGYRGRNYADSFSFEWKRWPRVQFERDNRGGAMQGHTQRMWEQIAGCGRTDLGGALIGDFGCGSGRFLDLIRRNGGRAIGFDLSYAVEPAWNNVGGNSQVAICQADVLHPPLRPGVLDGAFSIGVLHHTPDPARGVQAMARSTRRGGWLAVSVYSKHSFYDFPTVTLYRKFFRRLAPVFGFYPALLYSHFAIAVIRPLSGLPVLGLALRAAFPFARLPSRRWSLLDTFDALTPSYQSTHEPREVFDWLKSGGVVEIEPSRWSATSWRGFNATVP